jgi:hypothetical protein
MPFFGDTLAADPSAQAGLADAHREHESGVEPKSDRRPALM